MTTALATTATASPLVAAALTRVSREKRKSSKRAPDLDRDREQSPEQQWDRARLVTEIGGHPVELREEYREAQSASRFRTSERKRFPALVQDIKRQRYDLIILWEV